MTYWSERRECVEGTLIRGERGYFHLDGWWLLDLTAATARLAVSQGALHVGHGIGGPAVGVGTALGPVSLALSPLEPAPLMTTADCSAVGVARALGAESSGSLDTRSLLEDVAPSRDRVTIVEVRRGNGESLADKGSDENDAELHVENVA